MNISDIITKCYILALIIRDDGERLLLGDGFYEFTEQLQHFQPNTFQNDVIELQGTDGQLLAGQVRRGATQSFDGYIADSTTSREATEEHRQRFLAFFRKKHHYKVVYVFPDGSAIKRERGYIVDAPSVPEMFQRFPEFHVGLNFEDVNYYEYEEGEDGEEIFAHVQNIAIAGYVEGGLIWDNYGAVSNEITWVDYALKTTTDGYAQITDGVLGAPMNLEQLFGNATQTTIPGWNLFDYTAVNNLALGTDIVTNPTYRGYYIKVSAGETYTISRESTSSPGRFRSCFTKVEPAVGVVYFNKNGNQGIYDGGEYFLDYSVTVPDEMEYLFLYLSNSNQTITEAMHIQIEKGGTKHDWAPFVGGADSPNLDFPQAVNTVTGLQTVNITGKNLVEDVIISGSIGASGNIGTNASYQMAVARVMQGQTYTMTVGEATNVYGFFTSKPTIGSVSYDNSRVVATNRPTFTAPITGYVAFRTLATYTTPQLELGSISTAYEPYQGQSREINLGGNLINFAENALISDNGLTISTSSDGTIKWTGTPTASWAHITSNFAVSLPAGTYTFNIGKAFNHRIYVHTTPSYDFIIEPNQTSVTYTFSSAITAVQLDLAGLSTSTNYNESVQVMFAAGSQAKSYAPYTTYAYELAKIGAYRDAFKHVDGVWYKHTEIVKVIYKGSNDENWAVYGTGTPSYFYYTSVPVTPNLNDYGLLCNIGVKTTVGTTSEYQGIMLIGGNAVRVRVGAEKTISDWKTWLSTHNMILYYQLATPTDTVITDQGLIQQLSAILSLIGETNNVWLFPSGGAQGEMEVRYSRGFINQGAGYEWDAAQGGGPNIVSVDGIDRTGFVWEVVGPATNPTLTNITTNQTMTFEGDVATGQTLTVNTSDQTAEIAGTNVFAQMEGDWMQLAPDNNVITYTATGATEPSKIKWNGVVG